MKTKKVLQSTALTVFILLLTGFFTNAQIPFEGLVANHEGIAIWDADGTGHEPAAVGHPHPFGWGGSRYYCASMDYDNIDPDPNAALCHALGGMTGFPLFEQALIDHGFSPGQVKIKNGLITEGNDTEGEDWFTFNNKHHLNRYDGYCFIELNGEPMILFYCKNNFTSYDQSVYNRWQFETSYSRPFDHSQNSSAPVKEVAAAFLQDLDGNEIRLVGEIESTGIFFDGNGRLDGIFFNVLSGYLKKGMPELPFTGLASAHEGISAWDADGTGPEPQAFGHTFTYNGISWWMAYYIASRDYDDIDPDPNAALSHFTDAGVGFPNLNVQLEYRGYTMDQLKIKSGLATLGNNIEDIDWGLIGSTHWYHHYGNVVTLEIAGEPILEYVIDTNYGTRDVATINYNWSTQSSPSTLNDISANASGNAQHVAASFLKDLAGHSMKTYMEGQGTPGTINANGRDGVFHEINMGKLIPALPAGTLIWENEVSGTWTLAGSPYIVMGYLIIPDGEILTIDPGVEVKFNTTERFDIQGCLHAEGTEELPILFTAVDPDVKWGGMVWDQTPATNPNSALNHCIFEHSYAYGLETGYNCGGAIRINLVDSIGISHCIFRYNGADKFTMNNPAGGAIAMFECSMHISHCIFHDNSSSWGGAIIIGTHSDPVVDNCLFYNNESTFVGGGGGAGLSWDNSSPHFVNCTFADNHAVDDGGAYELELGGKTTFTNCIFWGNTAVIGASQISIRMDNPVPFLNVYYCDVEDGEYGITPGFQGEYLFNIEDDPEFVNAGGWLYLLGDSSPCIDSGTLDPGYLPVEWICPLTCLCGNQRILGIIDMGCYESSITIVLAENKDYGNAVLQVFPNPINSKPTIEFYLEIESSVQLSILDIHGRIVYETEASELQSGKNQLSFDAGSMAPGVYFCRLQKGDKDLLRKMVKF
ncbi:MAG: T9SS type A sorting domain-containing protein [Bacteroidales bacterium]|nr:T9SS type A sorting domain-containing protein [Bacteroidales bacterium]